MADVHVLLIYSLEQQKLLSERTFSEQQEDEAFAAYTAAEDEHRGLNDVEIVLLAADSIETIRRTHGSYFRDDLGAMGLSLEELLARS